MECEMKWLMPWRAVSEEEAERLCSELRAEACSGHRLLGVEVSALARRVDNDDVLFEIHPSREVAVVHLTWRGAREPDPRWPDAEVFDSLERWAMGRMHADHVEYGRAQ